MLAQVPAASLAPDSFWADGSHSHTVNGLHRLDGLYARQLNHQYHRDCACGRPTILSFWHLPTIPEVAYYFQAVSRQY